MADTSAPARKPMSEREHQVLSLVAEGLTNSQIGDRLCLSENTVKGYVVGLNRAWHVSSRGALVWAALREGVLSCPRCPAEAVDRG